MFYERQRRFLTVETPRMKAGFCSEMITPPAGTPMMGFARRDREGPSTGLHDDLFVRAAWP